MTVSRRRVLLTGGAVAGLGSAAAAGYLSATPAESAPATVPVADFQDIGTGILPFYGDRQSGITDEPPAHGSFVALTLAKGTDRAALGRLMRLLTDDAARLTRGEPALGDTDAELAVHPARLTVTFGFGPGLYRAAGLKSPVADLPAFTIDRLEDRWSGGDLVMQICSDDSLTVSHTQRMLIKDARPFGAIRWVQRGFRRSAGVHKAGFTQRNVFGQLDGTANPKDAAMETVVWNADHSTQLVVRRVRTDIETWDLLSVGDKENSTGRRMESGAPLTGTAEHDEPDFTKTDSTGLPVMPNFSHVTRAHVTDPALKILRRPFNYDEAPDAQGRPDSGLVFASYQADIVRQYLPIQRRLAEKDLLNEWTTPIGSAVFAIPPGCTEGGWIGERVLA
ncbi:MAG TPA: Dyp-type peroxidase [Actinoplanes sp.]|nr:Dyp-type peroxidase [Actinoplanes sp.]